MLYAQICFRAFRRHAYPVPKPLQHDYADLYDLMAFFAGKPDDVLGTPEHDAMAEAIASHSAEYVEKHWRWEDLQVYVSVVLLNVYRTLTNCFRCSDCYWNMPGPLARIAKR